jgi:hypothetical protein
MVDRSGDNEVGMRTSARARISALIRRLLRRDGGLGELTRPSTPDERARAEREAAAATDSEEALRRAREDAIKRAREGET